MQSENENEILESLENELLNEKVSKKEKSVEAVKNVESKIQESMQNTVQKSFIKLMLPVGIAFLVIGIIVTTVSAIKTSKKAEPAQPTLEGFDYLVQTQEGAAKREEPSTLSESTEEISISGTTNEQPQEQEVSMQEQEQNETTTTTVASYMPSQAIQSAFPEDNLVQIGSVVYKLPIKVSDLESAGEVKLIALGVMQPQADTVLTPMQRGGIIDVDGSRYTITLNNKADCTYKDLYVVSIIDESKAGDKTCIYTFGGIHIGSDVAMLPGEYTNFSTDDFSAINTYTYGTVTDKFTGSGTFTSVDVRGGKVVRIRVTDSTLESN